MTLPDDILSAYPAAIADGPWELLKESSGFSGARIWRSPAGWRLKAWPRADMTSEHLIEVHAWMRHATGLEFIPRVQPTIIGTTVVESRFGFWDLVSWLPGEPLLREPTPVRLAAAGRALARLHQCWQSCSPRIGSCPAIARRVVALEQSRHLKSSTWRDHAALVRRLSEPCLKRLAPWRGADFPLHPCLCDVWTDHVLFDGDAVTGLIDFGSAKIDHPAVDLARLLGDCLGGEPHRWQPLLDAYHAIRPLSPTDHSLLAVLESTGAVVALRTWLERLHHRPPTTAEAARLSKLVERCERLERVL